MGSQLGLINQSFIREALDELPNNFTITDPYVSGHPIVFASKGFLKMCGYDENDVIGRNGRIFQGPLTDRKSVMEIREAIREERSVQVNLLNYRKDGTQFWMLFHLSPVFSKVNGRVTHFVSVQVPIPRRKKGSLCNHVSKLQEMVLGSCRREVCGDTYVESSCIRTFDSFVSLDNRGLEPEESCEASDLERRQALTAINLILSLLTHYSEPFGRVACGKRCCSAEMGRLDSSLSISLGRIKQSFVLTDPHLHDMPIVYASDAFLHLTGYTKHEVLGCNWRFLNGPDTDVIAVNKMRENIQSEQACSVRILNYRKDGSSFWNIFHISPIRNASGRITFYIGVQLEEGCIEDGQVLQPFTRQLGAVGAVKVAVRTLSIGVGPSKSF